MTHPEPQDRDDVDETEEESLEITDDEGQEMTGKDKQKQLRTTLQEIQAEKRDLLEEMQRLKADFLNTKKRLEEQQKTAIVRNEDAFLNTLLPLADSFAMARKDTAAWEAIDEAWRKGVEGIHAQLERILKSYGVTEIDPVGQPFDPVRHDAVGTTEHDGESEMVTEVIQLGYERNGSVLRPAKVVISA